MNLPTSREAHRWPLFALLGFAMLVLVFIGSVLRLLWTIKYDDPLRSYTALFYLLAVSALVGVLVIVLIVRGKKHRGDSHGVPR